MVITTHIFELFIGILGICLSIFIRQMYPNICNYTYNFKPKTYKQGSDIYYGNNYIIINFYAIMCFISIIIVIYALYKILFHNLFY